MCRNSISLHGLSLEQSTINSSVLSAMHPTMSLLLLAFQGERTPRLVLEMTSRMGMGDSIFVLMGLRLSHTSIGNKSSAISMFIFLGHLSPSTVHMILFSKMSAPSTPYIIVLSPIMITSRVMLKRTYVCSTPISHGVLQFSCHRGKDTSDGMIII